jgi:hypothetical protein
MDLTGEPWGDEDVLRVSRFSVPSITAIDGVRRLRSHFHNYGLSLLAKADEPHPTPITLLMPVHPKDATRLAASVEALREHLAHPIERIVFVAPPGHELEALARRFGAELIDETSVLPAAVLRSDFRSATGVNRNGWFRQQFIKLGWPDWLDAERVLTMDADTKPVRRLRFITGPGQAILYTADDYSPDYFAMVQLALGPIKRAPWSFVAHTMLFERPSLLRMHKLIAGRLGAPWTQALLDRINPKISQCFSEFELYGNYMYSFERERVQLRYFRNRKVEETTFLQHAVPPGLHRFRTLSSHHRAR